MEFQTAHQYIRDLLPRDRSCQGWDGIPNDDLPAWYLSALSSVALLAQQADFEHVTGTLAGDAGEVHLHTEHAVVTLAVTALDSDSSSATVTTYPRAGLVSLQVASAESISGGQERGYYWPGEVTAVARYADRRTITLTSREGDLDDLVAFLPALLANLQHQASHPNPHSDRTGGPNVPQGRLPGGHLVCCCTSARADLRVWLNRANNASTHINLNIIA